MNRKKIYALLAMTVVLSGCAPKIERVPVIECVGSIITYDRLVDTLETIRQVKAHNAKLRLCRESTSAM